MRTRDGAVHLVIGDVCGHGPDEASLGVRLRMAWRTLVLAGLTGGGASWRVLDEVLGHERWSEEIFATLCTVTIDPAAHGGVPLAGHPAPLIFRVRRDALPDEVVGPALGCSPTRNGRRRRSS